MEPHPLFDLDDVAIPHAALAALPDEAATRGRLLARWQRGRAPTCAGAVLVERGDLAIVQGLAGVAAFLDPPDLAALVAAGATEALACIVAASWLAAPVRTAAAAALAAMTPSPGALVVLQDIAERDRDPAARAAKASWGDLSVRADKATRTAAERARGRVVPLKTWVGIRRQELQREVAMGSIPPSVALLAGDPVFLAGLVPPVADGARAALVPALLANVRGPGDEPRTRTFGLFHGRWREVARESLSAVARLSTVPDRGVVALAVESLARLGAWDDVMFALVSGGAEAQRAAWAALDASRAIARNALAEPLLTAAVAHLAMREDPTAATRLRAWIGG